MQSVTSSQISAIGHHPELSTLAIQFAGRNGPGPTYHYRNFTAEQFAALVGAESVGKHFYAHIKPFTEKYPFEKIESVATDGRADEAERVRLQAAADQHLADSRAEAPHALPTLPLPESVTARDAAIDDGDFDELSPTNDEITALGLDFGLEQAEWVERLAAYVTFARADAVAV